MPAARVDNPLSPMNRPFPFPWFAAVPPMLLLGFPVWTALTDLRAHQLARQADVRQDMALFDEATDLRRQAARLSPGDAQVELALAESLRGLWAFRETNALRREADAAFDRAAALSPHWPVPHYEHARMYAFKGQYARALSLLEPALRLDPNNAGYWLERARYLEALHKDTAARQAYARCWAIDTVRECETALKRLGDQS
ncbi:tetratricopeptide repeat protein [Deinococcus aerius]|uniref:tetratricopeptide repeat protein n=1 Tax=Deinococcus aerius TaxID=200253 RepID=UPI001F30191E|nr:tetratricopeptide repeat protein [Deinococcus aerius]